MSYQRPQDPYIHSNASQYDERYQHGAYRDDYPPQQGSYGYADPQGYAGQHTPAGSYGGFKEEYSPYHEQQQQQEQQANAATAAAQKYSYSTSKKSKSKWWKIGIPILLVIIAAAVIGGVLGARAASNNGSGSSGSGGSGGSGSSGVYTSAWSGMQSGNMPGIVDNNVLTAASAAAKKGGGNDLTFQGTDLYGNPSFKGEAPNSSPSASGNEPGGCAADNFKGSLTNLRPHPRIMTTKAQWDCLPSRIQSDAYLTLWHSQIMQNATNFFSMEPTNMTIDGGLTGSGILDPAREVQLRVKTLAYAYKTTNDTKWRDRLWQELTTAAGNNTQVPWSTWNAQHFLDLAELSAAFAIGYDWLYDAWTPDQRAQLRSTIVSRGLTYGVNAYTGRNNGADYGWWATTNGNWNCVSNSGLTLAALAIADEDTTGTASQILGYTINNMKGNCMMAVYPDGTWSETPNYWYFGSNAQARALSALVTATGSDQGLMAANPNWVKTGLFHMYVTGNAGMFFYGDNGPNKYATTANGMFLWGRKEYANDPRYALFQRDRADAADPLSMFWYDSSSKGAFWNGLNLDSWFASPNASWASMRSSWTDMTALYVGVKSSALTGHQAHGDLDAGTFVIDALGTRWAGELGNGNYLSKDYFASEKADAARWQYYRKGTQGQNTLVINNQNQNPDAVPATTFQSTNATQSGAVGYTPKAGDNAYFITDMGAAYNVAPKTVRRGIRMLNGRRQVLVQDEIGADRSINSISWRVHTNATVTLSDDKRTATLTLKQVTNPNAWGGDQPLVAQLPKEQKMVVKLLQPAGASFSTQPATPIYDQNPPQTPGEDANQSNDGVTVLTVNVDGGSAQQIQVVWQPQWSNLGSADSADPKNVALDRWTLTSHD